MNSKEDPKDTGDQRDLLLRQWHEYGKKLFRLRARGTTFSRDLGPGSSGRPKAATGGPCIAGSFGDVQKDLTMNTHTEMENRRERSISHEGVRLRQDRRTVTRIDAHL